MKYSKELQRRLDAQVDSAGPGVLLVLDALAMVGALTSTCPDLGHRLMHRAKYSVVAL